MTRYLLDTDTFSLVLRCHGPVISALLRHLADEVAVSIITVEELRDGVGSHLGRTSGLHRREQSE